MKVQLMTVFTFVCLMAGFLPAMAEENQDENKSYKMEMLSSRQHAQR